jgi:hypothetical protein
MAISSPPRRSGQVAPQRQRGLISVLVLALVTVLVLAAVVVALLGSRLRRSATVQIRLICVRLRRSLAPADRRLVLLDVSAF